MSDFGWAYVGGNLLKDAGGASGSVQYKVSPGKVTGSNNFIYTEADNSLYISGSLKVSGTIHAHEYIVIIDEKIVHKLNVSGSTVFGDSLNDTHIYTGSITVTGASNIPFFVTSSGRVGIGTITPTHLFHVSGGNAFFTNDISASGLVSASYFYGDGSNLSNVSNITYTNAGDNRVLTSAGAEAINGESNLFFDGSLLAVTGNLHVSGTALALFTDVANGYVGINTASAYNALTVGGNIGINQSLVHNGNTTTKLSYLTDRVILYAGGVSGIDIQANISPRRIDFGGYDVKIVGDSGGGGTSTLLYSDYSHNRIGIKTEAPSHDFAVSGTMAVSGNVFFENNLTASGHVSASAFYGDGSGITGVTGEWDGTFTGSAGISGSLRLSGSSSPLSIFGLLAGTAPSSSFLAASSNGTIILTSSLGTDEIGAAEDGSYADGLFADFTNTTKIGTAVDRFNEVLKALAPSPAPSLDDIDCADSGDSAYLSFGSSQSISGYTNVSTTAGFSAVDINGLYSSATSGNNLRRAAFDGSDTINGTLNADVASDGSYPNYPADSFGDADQGDLKLEVNGSDVHSVTLTGSSVGTGVPGSGTGTSLNANGSGFYDLSQTASAHFTDGTELDVFKHRTGNWKVHADDQRDGWNYARLVHTISGSDTETNYVEWVNDSNANALAENAPAFGSLSMTGELLLSGVKYFTAGSATYNVDVRNAYRNTYSATNYSFTTVKCSISSVAMPSINYGAGEDETKELYITGSATITSTNILNGSISVYARIYHPTKSTLSTSNLSISNILLYTLSSTSTVLSETFRREVYRLTSGSYASQSDVTDVSNAYDASGSLVSNDGLMVYNQALRTPTEGANSGDFSAITNGPGSNVDYSGITTGTRTYYRKFQNTSGGSQTNFDLTIQGSGTIVSSGTSLSTANIRVFVKLPNTSGGQTTGWMDLALAFATGQTSDDDGCLVGTLDPSLNATNEVTFGTIYADDDDWVMVKIEADATWTGNISAMSVSWS